MRDANIQPVPHSAESQWALVGREFRRRKLALVCVGVIVLLATVSIAAPFLANDRPLYYRGYNRFEYRESFRTLGVVLSGLVEPKKPAAPAPAASSPTASKSKKPVVKESAATIASRQLDLMEDRLSAEKAAELRAFRAKLIPAIEKAEAPGDAVPAPVRAELRALRTELRKSFDGGEVTLKSEPHWPVLAMLDSGDAGLLAFNVMLLLIPVWFPLLRRFVSPERGSLRFWLAAFLLCGLPLVGCGLWKLTVPVRIDRTHYKEGARPGDADAAAAPVVYESVVWPPIPFGLDEGNLARKYLRPALFPDKAAPASAVAKTEDDEPAQAKHVPGRWDKPHWLGTDGIGRDLLCRMLWGGRVSLSVGIVATLIEVALGIVFGAVAGYFRGTVDMVVSRIIEVVICFPSFFLILTIVTFIGPSIYNIMLVIGITGWTGLARLVRGEFLRLADQEFVLSARALGYSPPRIIFRHILPNAMAPVLVSATFAIAGAILIESGLSFLGLGITVPKPSWGGILSDGHDVIFRAPWIIYFPGLALFVTITAYNLVGEAFRDAADPRLRGQFR